ncbi:hypothetical protein JCM3765_000569 [Sporobolomyces pararoseus]
MSSSTSITASRALGECVVCGKECSQGCSKCKAAGLDWISGGYTSSFAAETFVWPLLSNEEYEGAWEMRNLPQSADTSNSLLQSHVEFFRDNSKYLAPVINQHGEETYYKFLLDRLISPEAVSNDTDQLMLERHRAKIFSTKWSALKTNGKGPGSPEFSQILSENPLYSMAWVESSTQKLIPEATFTSEFRHRLLVFVTLVSIALKQALELEVSITWDGNVEYSKSLLLPSARQLSIVNPAYAETVIRRVISEFMMSFSPNTVRIVSEA